MSELSKAFDGCLTSNSSGAGTFVSIRVQPGAKNDALCGLYDAQHIKIQLRSPPVDGAANENLIDFLKDLLGLKKSEISLFAGQKSRIKRVFVALDRPELVRRLESVWPKV